MRTYKVDLSLLLNLLCHNDLSKHWESRDIWTVQQLDKLSQVAEENKELLKEAGIDQIVESFPNTLLKMLPGEIAKTKWSKKAKEVVCWDDWWEMHEKVRHLTPDNTTRPSFMGLHYFLKERKSLNVCGDLYFKIVFYCLVQV